MRWDGGVWLGWATPAAARSAASGAPHLIFVPPHPPTTIVGSGRTFTRLRGATGNSGSPPPLSATPFRKVALPLGGHGPTGCQEGGRAPTLQPMRGGGRCDLGPCDALFRHPRPDVAGATNTTNATARAENRVVRRSSSLPHVSRDDLHLCGARNDSWSLYPLTNFQLQKISSMTGAHISSPTQCCNWLHSSPPHHPELYSLNTCFSVHSCSVVVMLELI